MEKGEGSGLGGEEVEDTAAVSFGGVVEQRG